MSESTTEAILAMVRRGVHYCRLDGQTATFIGGTNAGEYHVEYVGKPITMLKKRPAVDLMSLDECLARRDERLEIEHYLPKLFAIGKGEPFFVYVCEESL